KKKKKVKEKYLLKQVAPLGLIGFEGFKNPDNKMHYFHYHDEGGQALLVSRNYEKRKERDADIAAVIENGTHKKYYKTWKKGKKKHYFSIIDKNGKSFARSRYFESKAAMLAGMQHLQSNVVGYANAHNTALVMQEKIYSINLPKFDKKRTSDDSKVRDRIEKEISAEAITSQEKPETTTTAVVAASVTAANQLTDTDSSSAEQTKSGEGLVIADPQPPVVETILPQPGIKIEQEPTLENVTHPTPTPPPLEVKEFTSPAINEKIVEEKATEFPWQWLIAGVLGLFILGFIVKNCGNTVEQKAIPSAEVVEETPPPPIAKPKPFEPEPAKLGPTALELELTPNTAEARIADFLSNPKVKVPKTFILESVQFPFNSAVLTNTSFAQLNNVIRVMNEYPKVKIEVNGHTDSRGDTAMNKVLSEGRAKAVRDYLIQNGIKTDRILKAVGFGENDPIATNETDEGRQENRRSEVVIVER
ncbi:MAG: OmpA family protein, partial [Bacteroidota bacterium]